MKAEFLIVFFLIGIFTGIILIKYKKRDVLKKISLYTLKIMIVLLPIIWLNLRIFDSIQKDAIHSLRDQIEQKEEKIYALENEGMQILKGIEIGESVEERMKEMEESTEKRIKEMEESTEKHTKEIEEELKQLEVELLEYEEKERAEREKGDKKEKILEGIFEIAKTVFTYIAGLFSSFLSDEIENKIKSLKDNSDIKDENDIKGENKEQQKS